MLLYVILIAIVGWLIWMFLDRRVVVSRELGRFNSDALDLYSQFRLSFDGVLTRVGVRTKSRLDKATKKSEKEMARKLRLAGLETPVDQGRYIVFRTLCWVGGPALGSLGYLSLPPYYATLLMLTCSSVGIMIPLLWLYAKAQARTEDIQRELPLLIDLTNLGTSAGWDIAASLERVVDALDEEFPSHPLFREFKKAKWLAQSGFTWHETLERISERLENDTVRRCALAMAQAMKQGGDRTSQLEGIAEDAQRAYHGDLDKRLAGLPVKAVLITMLLLISYFMILMAPAAVQLKNTTF